MPDVQDIKERYQKFSQGDVEGAIDNWSDDFTWQGSNSTDLPGGGEHQGRDAAVQALQGAVGAWDEFELTPDEFYSEGDTVIVLGHTRAKKGDQEAEVPVVHIWRYDSDDRPCRLQILTDTYQTAQLLGKA